MASYTPVQYLLVASTVRIRSIEMSFIPPRHFIAD
jgi:hypothetical protein